MVRDINSINDLYSNIRDIKKRALEDNVPIMLDETIDFITEHIEKNKVKTILEIGTAVGYSAIMMALSSPVVNIVSIEKDEDRYIKALNNIKQMGLENRITLIFGDALDVKIKEKFDLIIIDAAKSKNLDFFSHFEKNLEVTGSIITDNLNFHGYVEKDLKDIPSKNIRGLVKKIKIYIDFLENNIKYKTKFYNIGDGLSVTERRLS